MEMNFQPNEAYDEESDEVDFNQGNCVTIGEKCGICMDVIIDRGVLDCCQHWFCFGCIDDWASITNLCPLCQNVFQSITCIPVYDTIGNNVVDEELLSGDDDWSIEGSSSTLSFPAYYIDENAVTCLDGVGCKIRNQYQTENEECDHDTSIACDTCNTWYHAYCVNFDTQGSYEDTWVCPRCKEPDACLVSDSVDFSIETSQNFSDQVASSGNIFVSIADAGETALVVSMVEADESHYQLNNDYFTDFNKKCYSSDIIKNGSDESFKEKLNISSVQVSETCVNRSFTEGRDSGGPVRSPVETEDACISFESEVGKSFYNGFESVTAGSLNDGDKALSNLTCDHAVKCTLEGTVSNDLKVKQKGRKEGLKTDVMSIVRGTGRRPSDSQNKAGLRVKKIMRRGGNDNESSVVLQELRKEIRDAVRNNSAEHAIDPKLLDAFRTALASSSSDHDRKLPSSAIKFKKTLLGKGKVRENLTKKIYGNSNGKRKRAWDRECEVEFWKHRCMRATAPEKVSTLNSVLNLLKSNQLDSENNTTSGCQEDNSILSRLYVADTSVFPRNVNILPLSATNDQKKTSEDQPNSMKTRKNGMNLADDKNKKLGGGSALRRNNIKNVSETALIGSSKPKSAKEMTADNDDRKKDKRRWALEVLAKKMAAEKKIDDNFNSEEDAAIKENFPILGQLPREMRPQAEPCRNKKIPVSVRQRQLYRLTEHFLKKLNMPASRRSADTELAVADAINIEKGIAERSNSKNGYLNLCSHEIMQRSNSTTTQASKSDSNISPPKEHPQVEDSADPDVLDALRDAGLVSDSPPHGSKEDNFTADTLYSDNILESDPSLEVDIYGDFEYDLDGKDDIGAGDVKISKQSREVEDSKLKIVLCSLNSSVNNSLVDSNLKCEEQTRMSGRFSDVPGSERDEAISLVECEALYGPDKEPLFKKNPDEINHVENLQTLQDTCKMKDGNLVAKKVEAYVKEHIRPLCKSGVISTDQYRWAVSKTTEKVMRYHSDSKNANFLIKEGDKVKKLAEEYVEAAQFKVDT